ncbi:MAG: tetratricopeptide repeat protein [Bacteroidota bacterium]
MRLSSYSLLIAIFFVFQACTPAEEKSETQQLEEAYWQNPTPENGQAIVTLYEGMLDTLDNDQEELVLAEKAALQYYRIGANEGLQANFAKILRDYQALPNSSTVAQGIMDSLLYGITDAETQRLIPRVARQYLQLTNTYAQARPDAPESPELLYKSGEIARSIGAFQEALNIYSNIESYFPQYKKAPKALFMQAFTYAEDLNDEEQARMLYERFLEKYPEDDFVKDAKILLENLGKSDEEIFQQLQNNSQ